MHKQAVFDHLLGRWRDLFNISYDVLLYASSHQVKSRMEFSPVCSHPLLLRECRVRGILVGSGQGFVCAARFCVCRLLPALFDGILDDQTIVGFT